jgi:Ca2+-binding RTX toxin-like protein
VRRFSKAVGQFPSNVSRIVIFGLSGNDILRVDSRLSITAQLFGNDGKDTLIGGDGNDSLDGGIANDILFGGGGNDLLRDLVGNNTLFGENGDDVLIAGAGNDKFYGGNGADLLRGGAGKDYLYGNAGNDILLGDAGDDQLFGGAGRDLLIGGLGNDTLRGEAGDDLLIADTTLFDTNDADLELIKTEWSSARSYRDRTTNLRVGGGSVLNGSGVSLIEGTTVLDKPYSKDTLYGGIEHDWFFLRLGSKKDKLQDKETNEQVN